VTNDGGGVIISGVADVVDAGSRSEAGSAVVAFVADVAEATTVGNVVDAVGKGSAGLFTKVFTL